MLAKVWCITLEGSRCTVQRCPRTLKLSCEQAYIICRTSLKELCVDRERFQDKQAGLRFVLRLAGAGLRQAHQRKCREGDDLRVQLGR